LDKKQNFKEALEAHAAMIFKIATAYTHSRDDRNDLIQEIHTQLWRSLDSFKGQSALSTWVYRVAMNVSLYHVKVTRRKAFTVPLNDHLHDRSDELSDQEDPWFVLKNQLDQLNLLDKALMILYLEDKSYEEIAAIMGITTSNVGTRLNRIRERIRQRIQKNQ